MRQLFATSPEPGADRVVAIAADAVTVFEAKSLAPIHRFDTRSAVRGAPAFTSDARYAFIATADGRVIKLDLAERRVAVEARASAATLALSGDDRYLALASDSPPALIILDAVALGQIKAVPIETGAGMRALMTAPPRQSFIAVPDALAELWEISYSDNPPHRGWVHDYRDDGVPAERPRFPVRRMEQRNPLDAIAFGDSHDYVVAASPQASSLQIIDLYIGRRFAEISLPGPLRLGASAQWTSAAESILAIPDPAAQALRLIDLHAWRDAGRIAIPSAVTFVSTHPSLRDVWASGGEAIYVVEKATRLVTRTIALGRPVMNIAFDRQGRRAIVSADGLLVAYDTATLAELTRVAMPGRFTVYGAGQ